MSNGQLGESSAAIRARAERARAIQADRFKSHRGVRTTAGWQRRPAPLLRKFCELQAECGGMLEHLMSVQVPPARVLGDSQQLAELSLGIFAGSKRIADFGEEGFAVVFAQPVESGAEGGFGAAEFLRKLSIRWRCIVRQMRLQCGEEGGLFAGIFSAQSLEAACQKGAKPEAVVGRLGLLVADELTFDALGIQREVGGAPAAALRVGVADLADEIAAKGDLEESAHSPAFRAQRIEMGAADELRDEALHEVLGIVRVLPHTPGESIEWTPIGSAQIRQRRLPLRFRRRAEAEDHAPPRFWKGVGHG